MGQRLEHSRFNLWVWVEWAALLVALGLLTLSETYGPQVPVSLLLLAVSFVARRMACGHWLPASGLEVPFVLFVGSAALATWISYNRAGAVLQFVRILGAIVLFFAICDSPVILKKWLAASWVTAAAGLALYWPMQHDFTAQPAKFALLTELGQWLNASLPRLDLTLLTGSTVHSNVVGGVLALAVPFGVALTWQEGQARRWITSVLSVIAVLVTITGLLLTSSRGAWIGLAASGGMMFLAWVQRGWFPAPRSKLLYWGTFALFLLALMWGILLTGNLERLAGQIPGPEGALQSRTQLWSQGIGLVRDYFFTGSGLMSFWMVHATYSLLIHVPYIAHIHNVFLEVWIEQGFLGALALVWGTLVVFSWAWRALDKRVVPALGWAGLAGLVVLAVHGLVDVVLYIERTLPLFGMVLGFVWWAGQTDELPAPEKIKPTRQRSSLQLVLAGLFIGVLGLIFSYRYVLGTWYANAGALAQTSLELTLYDPRLFDKISMDQVRRSSDLSLAEDSFRQALGWDPHNRTALQRLAQIELSRGQYAQALDHMQTAWDAEYRDDVTRLLYGDALAANRQPEQAAQVTQGLTWAESRLLGQAFYRYWAEQDYQRAADAWQAVLFLNPANQSVLSWLEQARQKANP